MESASRHIWARNGKTGRSYHGRRRLEREHFRRFQVDPFRRCNTVHCRAGPDRFGETERVMEQIARWPQLIHTTWYESLYLRFFNKSRDVFHAIDRSDADWNSRELPLQKSENQNRDWK